MLLSLRNWYPQAIPLSALANIGPAELYQPSCKGGHSRLSWLLPTLSRRRRGGDEEVVDGKTANNREISGLEKRGPGADTVEVPVLALSYWFDGEPR